MNEDNLVFLLLGLPFAAIAAWYSGRAIYDMARAHKSLYSLTALGAAVGLVFYGLLGCMVSIAASLFVPFVVTGALLFVSLVAVCLGTAKKTAESDAEEAASASAAPVSELPFYMRTGCKGE